MKPFLRALALILLPIVHLMAADTSPSSPGKPMNIPGIHNCFALSTNIFSGSAPDNDAAFAALAKLGVKTIISVDGTKPDVEAARKYNLRYVHIPHGYDGISTNTQLQLIKAAETLPGPIFVHCHHGKHRGPTAAAVICMAQDGWTPEQANHWLLQAGTSSNYPGLYQVVREFHTPTTEQLKKAPTTFPEIAPTPALVDLMVDVDNRWDLLKAVREAGYHPPKNHPDLDPADEVTILMEHFREAQRLDEAKQRGSDLLAKLAGAEKNADAFAQLLRHFAADPTPNTGAKLDPAFTAVANSCAACHAQYRDVEFIKGR